MTVPSPGIPLAQQPPEAVERMNLWAEARGEGAVGLAAVWWVVANRAARRDSTRAEEVLRRAQFSWTLDPDLVRKALNAHHDDPIGWTAADIVCWLGEVGLLADPTHGATHYLNRATLGDHQPAWSLPENGWIKLAVIGRHEFGRAA